MCSEAVSKGIVSLRVTSSTVRFNDEQPSAQRTDRTVHHLRSDKPSSPSSHLTDGSCARRYVAVGADKYLQCGHGQWYIKAGLSGTLLAMLLVNLYYQVIGSLEFPLADTLADSDHPPGLTVHTTTLDHPTR
jgi:hypothetical protein